MGSNDQDETGGIDHGVENRADGTHAPADPGMIAAITTHIRQSLLSGDTPLSDDELSDVAQFLLETAACRKDGPAIGLASASEGRRFIRIAIINDDMPFLVDSLALAIAEQGLVIDRLIHPVVPVRRDGDGMLHEVGAGPAEDAAPDTASESMIYIETSRVDAKQRRALEQAVAVTVGDVRAAVNDWAEMRALLSEDADSIADEEGAALLRWLNDGMMTHLGHITRRRDGTEAQTMGICRRSTRKILADASYDAAFDWFDRETHGGRGRAPLVVKANRISLVHRRVPLDLFIVPVMEDGTVVALSIHAGIWTSAAMNTPPDRVPRMRRQLAKLMDKLGFDPGGHTGKSLLNALTKLPHDLVIGFSDSDIERVATTMTSLTDRPRPKLTLVEAPLARHLFAFVWLPRDMISTSARQRIQTLLSEATGAEILDWSLQVEGGVLAMMRFVLDIRDAQTVPDETALDDKLQAMLRGWPDAVEAELAKDEEPGRAAAIAAPPRLPRALPRRFPMATAPNMAQRRPRSTFAASAGSPRASWR